MAITINEIYDTLNVGTKKKPVHKRKLSLLTKEGEAVEPVIFLGKDYNNIQTEALQFIYHKLDNNKQEVIYSMSVPVDNLIEIPSKKTIKYSTGIPQIKVSMDLDENNPCQVTEIKREGNTKAKFDLYHSNLIGIAYVKR